MLVAPVAGLVDGTADAPAPNLQTKAVRDLVLLNAVVSGATITYDIATVEMSVPDSKMYRYSVAVTHGSGTAYPTIGAVTSLEFLE